MAPATVNKIRSLGAAILDAIENTKHLHISIPISRTSSDIMSTTAVAPAIMSAPSGPAPPAIAITEPSPLALSAPCPEEDSGLSPQGPYIPAIGRGEWKMAIQQWHEGNPAAGMKPLKDWPKSYYSGPRRKEVASTRRKRFLSLQQHMKSACTVSLSDAHHRLTLPRCGSDDAAFLAAYPEASQAISALLDAIRERQGLRRCKSKSQSPALSQQQDEHRTCVNTFLQQ